MKAASRYQIDLDVIPEAERGTLPAESATLGFGKLFTDHMFRAEFGAGGEWSDLRVVPFQPLSLSPAAMVLHYSQTVFEGLKAFYGDDGVVRLFRPERNARRMADSCRRLCMPPVPEDLFVEAVRTLLEVERHWVPKDPGTAMYVRPFVFGSEGVLGVRPSREYQFIVILSPVGSYFPEGFRPIKLWVTDEFVRAVPGGIGMAKTGGNYAASLLPGQLAAQQGFNQVMYLDGIHHRFVEEVGAMNMMFVKSSPNGNTVVTPELNGSILPGVTRDSVIHLARHLGHEVVERPVPIDEVLADLQAGSITEIFGTGTAASIAPVGLIRYHDRDYPVGGNEVGPVAAKLYQALQNLQYGREPDTFGWTVEV